jgi:hypothetical protein
LGGRSGSGVSASVRLGQTRLLQGLDEIGGLPRPDAGALLDGFRVTVQAVVQTPHDFADEQDWELAYHATWIDPHLIHQDKQLRPDNLALPPAGTEAPASGNMVRRRGGRGMKKSSRKKKKTPKRVLRLPDLDYAKGAVLNTLVSPASKRSYELAIDDFVIWYCSEPRLAFSKTVVLRYRLELESRQLAPATINLRLAAVRRLASEAADTGLLSPELAAGIRRVKGAKKVGVRVGNWLTADQSLRLLQGARGADGTGQA